jgi:hypothetical protein
VRAEFQQCIIMAWLVQHRSLLLGIEVSASVALAKTAPDSRVPARQCPLLCPQQHLSRHGHLRIRAAFGMVRNQADQSHPCKCSNSYCRLLQARLSQPQAPEGHPLLQ